MPRATRRWWGGPRVLTDAFYWASTDDPSGTPDISLLDQVGGCFETVAEGLLLVRDARHRRGGLERALPLLAEAQSALRQSLRLLGGTPSPTASSTASTTDRQDASGPRPRPC